MKQGFRRFTLEAKSFARAHIAALCLCAVLVIAVGIGFAVQARSADSLVYVASSGEKDDANEQLVAADVAQQTYVYVYVCGEVRNPGVYGIAEGSRLDEAIALAGGFTDEACVESINLARVAVDGEQVCVPSSTFETNTPEESGVSSVEIAGSTVVNINRANKQQLESLPGIGPSLAQRIIDYRNEKGAFSKIEDLKQVSGIGDKRFEELRDLIAV